MKLPATSFLPLLLLIATGCNALPPGRIEAMSPGSDAKQTAVYLLRGWRGLWSAGIDDLAAQLRQEGINASVYREEQWKPLADQIAADLARSGRRGPLVLIGFSYGADNVIEMARAMEARGIPVDLLVTIDPVTAAPVPRNVRECVNFYQSNGFWDIFPWLRGTPLKRDPPGGGKLVNYDLRKDRTDLLEPGTSHATIAGNAKLHRAIIELVENLIPKQGSQSARCNTTARPPFTSVPSITIGVSEIWS